MKLANRDKSWLLALIAAGILWGCGASATLSADKQSAKAHLYAVEPSDPENRQSGMALGEVHLGDEACAGVDRTPVYEGLTLDDLMRFLEGQGVAFEKSRAREDLHYLDLRRGKRPVRLRVALLKSAREAGRDLHEALLEHGQGSWGVHRGNLAVLGPVADVDDIIAFAVETKLACWGVLTIAGRDDNFVVSGGYAEL